MQWILLLLLGIIVTFIGFKMYSYFDKNLDSIDNQPGNLYGKAALFIATGIVLIVISIIGLAVN